MLEKGTKAPAFSRKTHSGDSVALKDLRGQKVALYFYPKDDTPGCTKQACNLRDHVKELKKAGVVAIGVSPDDDASHEKFTDKYKLNFPLIADPKMTIINKYGVWGEKNMYGVKKMGLKRTTFLIDEEGVIVDIIKRPKVAEHTEEILRRFEKATQ